MKRLLILFALLGLAAPLVAAEPQSFAVPVTAQVVPIPRQAADVIRIDGPDVITAGKPVAFPVSGLDTANLTAARVIYFPREDVLCVPAQTWGGTTIIWFQPGNAAQYFLAIYTPNGYTEKIITTKGVKPPVPIPDPTPDPTPPPLPSGDLMVLVLFESEETTPAIAAAVQQLYLYCKREGSNVKVYRCLDKDTRGKDGKPVTWLKGYIRTAESKKVPLPALMVGVLSSSPNQPLSRFYVEPLPGYGADMIQTLKKYGG